jgi:uncharacterized protein (TIGR02466 family)
MIEVLELFPTTVFKNFYPHTDKIKKDLFSKLEIIFREAETNNNAFMRDGTLCSYNSNSYLHKDFPEETKDVIYFVEDTARQYWKKCKYHNELNPYVFQMWANSTPRGGWIHSHLHGNMPFTAVLYIDASPDQGNLILENPMDTILMNQPISPDVEYPMCKEIEVSSGDLIMFPGYLKHRVKPNNTDRQRLILGFNIGCKGKYWSGQWVKEHEKN